MNTRFDVERLVTAVFEGKMAVLETLMSGISGLNVCGEHWTPLHAAIESGSHAMVKRLMELGADPNYEGGNGSPLEHAIDLEIDWATQENLSFVPDTGLIPLLLAHGADPAAGENKAVKGAESRGHLRAAELLRAATGGR